MKTAMARQTFPLSKERLNQIASLPCPGQSAVSVDLTDFRALIAAARRDLDVRVLDEWAQRAVSRHQTIFSSDAWACLVQRYFDESGRRYGGNSAASARHAAAEAINERARDPKQS